MESPEQLFRNLIQDWKDYKPSNISKSSIDQLTHSFIQNELFIKNGLMRVDLNIGDRKTFVKVLTIFSMHAKQLKSRLAGTIKAIFTPQILRISYPTIRRIALKLLDKFDLPSRRNAPTINIFIDLTEQSEPSSPLPHNEPYSPPTSYSPNSPPLDEPYSPPASYSPNSPSLDEQHSVLPPSYTPLSPSYSPNSPPLDEQHSVLPPSYTPSSPSYIPMSPTHHPLPMSPPTNDYSEEDTDFKMAIEFSLDNRDRKENFHFGIPKALTDALYFKQISEKEENRTECPVCQMKVEEGDQPIDYISTPCCGNLIHQVCINDLVKNVIYNRSQSISCPLCRKRINIQW